MTGEMFAAVLYRIAGEPELEGERSNRAAYNLNAPRPRLHAGGIVFYRRSIVSLCETWSYRFL